MRGVVIRDVVGQVHWKSVEPQWRCQHFTGLPLSHLAAAEVQEAVIGIRQAH